MHQNRHMRIYLYNQEQRGNKTMHYVTFVNPQEVHVRMIKFVLDCSQQWIKVTVK